MQKEILSTQIVTEQVPKIIDRDLGIVMTEMEGGRRKFELKVGLLGHAEVLDIPAISMSKMEWKTINLARNSYARMWGGGTTIGKIKEDPFEGFLPYNSQYLTTHQIAIFRSFDGREKIATNRKVALNPESPVPPPLFDDIVFWNVVNLKTQERIPLSEILSKYVQKKASSQTKAPEIRLAAISRTGTYPYSPREKSVHEHDMLTIAWTMMQIATTYENDNTFFSCQLGETFQDEVLTITDTDGKFNKLDFTKTEDVLGLDKEWQIKLDRDNPYIQSHLLEFPGYWLDGNSLNEFLNGLFEQDKLASADFISPSSAILSSDESGLVKGQELMMLERVLSGNNLDQFDLLNLTRLFTKPRYCKYLIPLFNKEGYINSNLHGNELRAGILTEVAERPFSSTLIPSQWRESALNMLRVAENKYRESRDVDL